MRTWWKFVSNSHFSFPSAYVDRPLHSKLQDLTLCEKGLSFTKSNVGETIKSSFVDWLWKQKKWVENGISEKWLKEQIDSKTFSQCSFLSLDNLSNIVIYAKMFSNCHYVSLVSLCVCTVSKSKENLHDFPEIDRPWMNCWNM